MEGEQFHHPRPIGGNIYGTVLALTDEVLQSITCQFLVVGYDKFFHLQTYLFSGCKSIAFSAILQISHKIQNISLI